MKNKNLKKQRVAKNKNFRTYQDFYNCILNYIETKQRKKLKFLKKENLEVEDLTIYFT